MQGEPEVNADQLDNVLENNVAAENAAAAESSENEATADHQCNDKEQMISQSSLKDDGTDKSRVNLDKGNVVSINEETLEEAKVQRRNLGRLWLMEHRRHLSCRYVLTQLVTPQQSLVNSKMVISCVMGIYQMIEG